jgi:hypothetical protein
MADNIITVEYTPIDTFQSTDVQTISGSTFVAQNRLDALDDVTEPVGVANNMTLVYNSTTDKYTVQELNLDGGTF